MQLPEGTSCLQRKSLAQVDTPVRKVLLGIAVAYTVLIVVVPFLNVFLQVCAWLAQLTMLPYHVQVIDESSFHESSNSNTCYAIARRSAGLLCRLSVMGLGPSWST